MKPLSPAFTDAAGPDQAAMRAMLLTALYFVLLIDADERHDAEHRRVLDRRKAHARKQQKRSPVPRPPTPGL